MQSTPFPQAEKAVMADMGTINLCNLRNLWISFSDGGGTDAAGRAHHDEGLT